MLFIYFFIWNALLNTVASCLNHIFGFLPCYFLVQGELIESSSDEDESGLQDEKQSGSVLDMEDLGNIMNRVNQKKVGFKSLYIKKRHQFFFLKPPPCPHHRLTSVCQVRSKCVITEGTVADGLTDTRPSTGEKRKLV